MVEANDAIEEALQEEEVKWVMYKEDEQWFG